MDWDALTGKYHNISAQHRYRLDALEFDWQRELAAIFRLEMDVNNGGYLQFLANWKRENFHFAHQGLIAMGAARMAEIVHDCQSIVDEQFDVGSGVLSPIRLLLPNQIISRIGRTINVQRLYLSRRLRDDILNRSYEFMNYPDDIATLGITHYSRYLNDA